MSKADGISQPRRSQQPRVAPDAAPRRAAKASYDSDQIPVLIRLPDLTESSVTAVGSPPTAAPLSIEQPPVEDKKPDRPAALEATTEQPAAPPWKRNRRSLADRDAVPRRYTVRGLLATLPSQALVVLFLAAVTALVYLLVQGLPPAADNSPAAANVNVAAAPHSNLAPAPGETRLWPVSNTRGDSTEGTADTPEPAGAAQESSGIPQGMLVPSFVQPEGAMRSDGPQSNRTAMPAEGPQLKWQPEAPATAPAADSAAPVQGWPPAMGADSTGRDLQESELPRSVTSYDRSAYDTSHLSPGPVTYDDDLRNQFQNSTPAGATLNGTIDFPQPRVDYERTRSGIY